MIIIISFFNYQLLIKFVEIRFTFINKLLTALCSSQSKILLIFFNDFMLCLLCQNKKMLKNDAWNFVNKLCLKFKSLCLKWSLVIDLMNEFKKFRLSILNACVIIVIAEMKETWILLRVCNKNDYKNDWFF